MSQQRPSIPYSRRIQRIQLEAYDDVVSIKDRLQFVKAGRVLLVLPKRGAILQRKIDLVLIQREAARLGLRLAFVTQDVTVADHAQELNISVFYNVEQARTSRWKRPLNKVFVDRADRPQQDYDYSELQRKATRLKPPPTAAQRIRGRIVRGVVFGVAILAIVFGLLAFIPRATITLTPASDQLNVTIPLLADPNLTDARPEALSIPATVRRFPQDATVTIDTSGRRNAEDSLAEGRVTLTNETGLATFVPAGTIVQTEGAVPVRFQTLEDAALPARQGAVAEVRIRALESSSGVQGNVPADAITRIFGSLAESIAVRNFNPTYGGGVREAAFATQADRDRLLTLARQQIKQNARDRLLLTLEEDESFLVTDSIQIVEERLLIYSAEVNEPADSISLTMQAFVEATTIDLRQARLVAFANLGNYIAEGRVINERSLTFRRGEVTEILDDGRIAFQLRVEGTSRVAVDPSEVRQLVTGKSARAARQALEDQFLLDPRQPPMVETWPPFFNRLPIFGARIEVRLRS